MADVPEFDESLMPEVEPSELGLIELDQRHLDYAAARWPGESERMQIYRVRQAIWVRFQNRKVHPDDPGRKLLGGPQPNSGRRVQKKMGAAFVEHFEGRQKEVLDAIAAPLAPGSDASAMERHKAGMAISKHILEQEAADREADEYARKTDDEVRKDFAKMLAQAVRDGELSIEDIIEGSGVEIPLDQGSLSA